MAAITDELPVIKVAGEQKIIPSRRFFTFSVITGNLVAGMIMLALGVALAQLVSSLRSAPGPGALMVISHLAGAALCAALYRITSRYRGIVRALAASGVLAIIVILMWFFWWGP